jgi:hypothetical protein
MARMLTSWNGQPTTRRVLISELETMAVCQSSVVRSPLFKKHGTQSNWQKAQGVRRRERRDRREKRERESEDF